MRTLSRSRCLAVLLNRRHHGRIVLALSLVLTACQSRPSAAPHAHPGPLPAEPALTAVAVPSQPPQLFDDLGSYTRPLSTRSRAAADYFNQGLTWLYAFNHDEAVRSFGQAAQLDPDFAFAWWGIALAHGPHINAPFMPKERTAAAWSAIQRAVALKASASPVEAALIEALGARYREEHNDDRRALDEAYAAAMQRVAERFPDDPDVRTLYAEALMDLQPWDFWTPAGEPRHRTEQIAAILESVIARYPTHPGACHYYIHAMEAGPNPERALAAANALRAQTPISGHLIHMPSHIDVQVGAWDRAATQNIAAGRADRTYRARVPHHGMWQVYMAHNTHFLAFVRMMQARERDALTAADAVLSGIPVDYAKANAPFVDAFYPIRTEVLLRFGRWSEVLGEPAPMPEMVISTAMHHHARGIAHAALGDTAAADRELEQFRAAVQKVPENATLVINNARKVLRIAELKLLGEIELARGNRDEAITLLREAVGVEDTLLYMEPPEWMTPVRHALGAVLLAADRAPEAEAVYRRDLEIWPENAWSLLGLSRALEAQSKTDTSVTARRDAAWKAADVQMSTSCACVTAAQVGMK